MFFGLFAGIFLGIFTTLSTKMCSTSALPCQSLILQSHSKVRAISLSNRCFWLVGCPVSKMSERAPKDVVLVDRLCWCNIYIKKRNFQFGHRANHFGLVGALPLTLWQILAGRNWYFQFKFMANLFLIRLYRKKFGIMSVKNK